MGYQWQEIPENASASPARLSEEEWVAALLYWDMAAKLYLQAIPLHQPLSLQDERIRSFTSRLGQASAKQIRLRLQEEMDP